MDAVTLTIVGLILTALTVAISKDFRDTLGKIVLWMRRCWFRLVVDRVSPMAEHNAKRIAASVLAGEILEAIPYRNFRADPQIAVLRRSPHVDTGSDLCVLERLGSTYRVVWENGLVLGRPTLQVRDIDGDGAKEVMFVEESFGTGAGTRSFLVYSTGRAKLYRVTEHFNWQDAAGPASPVVTVEPTPDRRLGRAITSAAARLGLLKPTMVDFERAEFAVQRWHAENGTPQQGRVRLHYYPGECRFEASRTSELAAPPGRWIGFFKGPVVVTDNKHDRHAVVFSSAWIYNWPTCLCTDGETVFWGIANEPGLMACRIQGDQADLRRYSVVRNAPLPEITDLMISGSFMHVNGTLAVHLVELWPIPWDGAPPPSASA